jgi:hypothetical protein
MDNRFTRPELIARRRQISSNIFLSTPKPRKKKKKKEILPLMYLAAHI